MNNISNQGFTIVSKENCKYCEYSCKLLNEYDIPYKKIEKDTLTCEELKEIKPTDHNTFPIIFHDREFVGGFMELRKYMNNSNKYEYPNIRV